MTFEEAQDYLTEVADSLPEEIFNGLNGGIVLLPEIKLHPVAENGSMYTLGEYRFDPLGLGRSIVIYYGSFQAAHGYKSLTMRKKELENVLYHELTHHLENLAGDRSLEIQDAIDIARYREQLRGNR